MTLRPNKFIKLVKNINHYPKLLWGLQLGHIRCCASSVPNKIHHFHALTVPLVLSICLISFISPKKALLGESSLYTLHIHSKCLIVTEWSLEQVDSGKTALDIFPWRPKVALS